MKNVPKKGKKRTKRAPDWKQPSGRGKLPELCSTLLFLKPPCFPSLLGHAFSVPPAFSHPSPPTLLSRVAKWTTNGWASRALFSHGPPPNETNAGRPFGRRRPSRASSQPTTRCAGRRRPAGRRPRASSRAGDSDRPRRGPRRSVRSSRDVGRARYASLQISDALLFGASTRASSAVRALVARRPPASERRVSRAAGTSLARRVPLSYAVYIPGMTHFHQPRGRMVAYTRGEEFLATRRSRVRISPVPKPKK